MPLPKLQYIQKIEVHEDMVELYQQFLLKLKHAQEQLSTSNMWTVYENVFGTVRTSREFVFIRPLNSWSDLDDIALEKNMSQVMVDIYGEKDALQWMKIAQKSIKRMSTSVLSKIDQLSLD